MNFDIVVGVIVVGVIVLVFIFALNGILVEQYLKKRKEAKQEEKEKKRKQSGKRIYWTDTPDDVVYLSWLKNVKEIIDCKELSDQEKVNQIGYLIYLAWGIKL